MKCSRNYSETVGSLFQYYRAELASNNNVAIVDFTDNNATDSFKLEEKIPNRTGNDGTKNDEIMVPLKNLSNFCRTLEIPLINSEINLMLTCVAI